MIVEAATPSDFPAIAELNVEAYRQFAAQVSPAAWQAMQRNLRAVEIVAERAQFLVVRGDAQLAGSVAYCPAGLSDATIFPADWPSVLLLAVAPRWRGHGIAQELVQACIHRARHDGAPVLGLFTSELMTSARRIYEALGFQQDGEIPRRHGLRYWRYRLPLVARPAANDAGGT